MLFQLSIANISGPFYNPIDMIFVFAVYIVSRFVQNFEQLRLCDADIQFLVQFPCQCPSWTLIRFAVATH